MTDQVQEQVEKLSYRSLLLLRANGFNIDDVELRIWRREEELIRSAMYSLCSYARCGLEAGHFAAPLHSLAWDSLMAIARAAPDATVIEASTLLSEMRNRDERLGGPRGVTWLASALAEVPVPPEYGLLTLAREVMQHHRLRLWRARAERLNQRVGTEVDLAGLQNEYVSLAAQVIVQVQGEGAVDRGLEEIEWDPRSTSTASLVRTGVDAIDRCGGGGHGRGELLVWGGGTSHGKCLRRRTIVMMHDGSMRKVEEVAVGDQLMGPDGAPRLVLGTNRGRGRMFEVRPRKGESFFVNGDHVLTLIGTGTKATDKSEHDGTRWGDQIVDVSLCDYQRWSKKRKHNFKLFRVGVERFGRRVRLPLAPYFLGVLLGDGCLSQGQAWVSTPEEPIVSELRRQAELFGLEVNAVTGSPSCPTYSLSHGPKAAGRENPLLTVLRGLGLCPSSAGTKFIPESYKTASRRHRLELLAGILDTDGYAVLSGYDYISKSERLARDVAFVARSLGYAAYVKPCKKGISTWAEKRTYYRVAINGEVDEVPVRVGRRKVASRRKNRNVLKVGFQVIPTGTVEPYYGFTLTGDGRFLLGDFTVTHNSYAAQRLLERQAFLGNRALYISCEDAIELMFCRQVADFSQPSVSPRDIRTKKADPDVVEAAIEKMRKSFEGFIKVVEIKKPTISQVVAAIQRFRYAQNGDLVIVDYLQAITEDEPTTNKVQEMASVTSKLKRCFTECRVAGVVFSQYARDSYRDGTEPGLNSCKYCGDIENEAETMVLFWKDTEGVLHAKLPKTKWTSATDLRYTVPINQVTGCHEEWQENFTKAEDDNG